MKKGLLLAVVIAAVTLTANAQEGNKKDRLATLQLTTQQKASVDSVRKIYEGQRASLKKDAGVTAEAKTEKLKAVRKEQNNAINSILTKEQKQQLKKESTEGKKED